MILRNGVDIVEIDRVETSIARYGNRFLSRVFTNNEIVDSEGRTESFAVRFAAKEAVSKALGTGIGQIGWKEIEVLRGSERQPYIKLAGTALKVANKLGIESWSLSLSHTRNVAIAFVIGSGS